MSERTRRNDKGEEREKNSSSERRKPSTHLDKLVRHPDVLRVDPHVLGRRHRDDRHGTLVPKGLVRPRPHGADKLDGREPVVGDEHRVDRAVPAHLAAAGLDLRVERGDALGNAHLERVGALPGVFFFLKEREESEKKKRQRKKKRRGR